MAVPFLIGARVILHDLKTRSEYNGRAGVVVQPLDVITGRCLVKLHDGEECSLRLDNLKEDSCGELQHLAAPNYAIGSRVMLHGLVAQPLYNARVGLVSKAVQLDTGRCCVTLCQGGEEVTVRTQNLKDVGDAAWTAAATSHDASLEVLLKAVAFLSKFKSFEQNELIAKMKVKDKFDFMREGSSKNAFFLDCLKKSFGTPDSKHQNGDTCCLSLPNEDLHAAINPSPQKPTFSFQWSKGEAHCVENEIFDPSDIDERSNLSMDATALENSMFGSEAPKLFPVRSTKFALHSFFFAQPNIFRISIHQPS
jgi:hypothetical protein